MSVQINVYYVILDMGNSNLSAFSGYSIRILHHFIIDVCFNYVHTKPTQYYQSLSK